MKEKKRCILPPVLAACVLLGALLLSQAAALRVPVSAPEIPVSSPSSITLTVHFIDVGQAEAILIQSGQQAMLIDAGNDEDAELIVDYLRQQGITRLKYAVGTHPHEDHLGALDSVLTHFEVETLLLSRRTLNAGYVRDVLEAAEETETPIGYPSAGDTLTLGEDRIEVLAPIRDDYDEVNNASLVLRYTHGSLTLLLCADMQAAAERDLLDSGISLRADVLKVAHHGSDTSSTAAFLAAVDPQDAVISVGSGNDYSLPSPTVLNRLQQMQVTVWRTDQLGTIRLESDGVDYTLRH